MLPPSLRAAVAVATLLLAPAAAHAGNPVCDRLSGDAIEVDGMLDDWQGTRKQHAGGDEGFDLRCGYDDKNLYLAVRVTDWRMIRTRKADPRHEDALTVELAAAAGKPAVTLVALPGVAKVAPRRSLGGKPVPSWLRVEDTLQQDGWSLELALPMARIPGLGSAPPSAWARVLYRDVDAGGATTPVELRGELTLAGAVDLLRGFLRATHLARSDLVVDVKADVGGGPGLERVVAGGTVIGVIADQFGYFSLPVDGPRDVAKVEVRDLAGDGTSFIVTQYHQRGSGGGSRDVVAVWSWDSGSKFDRVLSFEVGKQLGDKRLTSKWSYVPRGSRRKGGKKGRGFDILVEAAPAVGWDEDSWGEQAADDVRPILLPWEPKHRTLYWFADGRAAEAAPTAGR